MALMPRAVHFTGDIDVHEVAADRQGTGRSSSTRLFLPCDTRPGPQLPADLEAELHFRAGPRGPLSHERARDARREAEICDCSEPDRRRGWLARPAASQGRHHRRRDGSGRDRPAVDAAFAAGGPDGKLYAVDSGRGFLVEVDKETGKLRDIAFCPGFLRGLALINGFALVTVSKPRYGTFEGMPIDDEMKARNLDPICAVLVIDLARGEIVEWLRLEGDVQELFTVELMPGVNVPMVGRAGDRRICRKPLRSIRRSAVAEVLIRRRRCPTDCGLPRS